jgi:peptide/nickel transport system substrate-binding protein
MKKFFAVLVAISPVFALVACGGGNDDNNNSNSPGGEAKDTLTVAFTQDRGTLDPMYMIGYDSMNAMRMVYETLWDFDKNGEQVWTLATDLEIIEPTVWHIHIREGVTFANGNPFTAEDVVFSLWRGNNRVGEPDYLPELNLDKTRALDDYTVELVLNAYDLSYVAGMSSLVMFDKESFDEETAATTPNGTGPYVLEDYVINSHIYLKARDDYWGEKPAIKNLKFRIMSEDSQRVNALQTGTVDIAKVPFQDIEFVQTLDDINVYLVDSSMSRALYFNPSEHSIFYNNPDARKAVALAIDRQAIVDLAYSGFAEVSRLPVSMANVDVEDRFLDVGIYGIGYNPELAKEYAEKAGIVGKKILLINNGSSDAVVVSELIQADLKDIGIEVEVQSLDPGSWLTIVFDDTQYDMCIDFTSVPSMTLAQNFYAWVLYHIGGSYTRNPWPGKDRYLELVNDIMAVDDPAELSERYMELVEMHTEAMLWYSLVDMKDATGYNSDLKNFNPMLMGNVNYAKLSW